MQKTTIGLLSLVLGGQMFASMAPGFAQRVCPAEMDRQMEAILAYEAARAKAHAFPLPTSWPDDPVAQEKYNQQQEKVLQDWEQAEKGLGRANDLLELCLDHVQKGLDAHWDEMLGRSPPNVQDIPPMERNQ